MLSNAPTDLDDVFHLDVQLAAVIRIVRLAWTLPRAWPWPELKRRISRCLWLSTSRSCRPYDRLAPLDDRLHRRSLRHAGGEAQVALEAAVRAVTTPATNLLDAGCGTGVFARTLIADGVSPAHVTLLDPSDAMLSRSSGLRAHRVRGRLKALPFTDGKFDTVTCAWALERRSGSQDWSLGALPRRATRGRALPYLLR